MVARGQVFGNLALLALLGWLRGAVVASQEFCNSPGELPAPMLIMNVSSARQGGLAVAQCIILSSSAASTIFFCKDGVVLAKQLTSRGQFFAKLTLNLSVQSAGHYACRYERTLHLSQTKASGLSIPWHLRVTGPPSGSDGSDGTKPNPPCRRLDLGEVCLFTALFFLALLLAIYLLGKMVASKQRCQRISSSCLATEEQ
ncbi:uncharacterized protein LOC112547323 isoform X2 [Pelodiscus sinensis]|uniref:uncharacterized protein LOC112547323 isoform X2 n=1 Tax=Pelodiscus sinensis TaxID=13735 RepID=UPI003F6BCEE8